MDKNLNRLKLNEGEIIIYHLEMRNKIKGSDKYVFDYEKSKKVNSISDLSSDLYMSALSLKDFSLEEGVYRFEKTTGDKTSLYTLTLKKYSEISLF